MPIPEEGWVKMLKPAKELAMNNERALLCVKSLYNSVLEQSKFRQRQICWEEDRVMMLAPVGKLASLRKR